MPILPLSSTYEPTILNSIPNTQITSPAATAHENASTTNTHHMVTRAKAKISKPLTRMNCHATTTLPIPRSHLHALRDPNWHKAMVDAYNALISNRTWALMPRPTNVNIVRSMWLFKHKFNADGLWLDVKNAFIHGHLSKTVYMHQPPGFVDSAHPDYHSKTDTSLFVYHMGSDVAYLLLYVDGIIFTSSSTALLQRIIALLHSKFAMTDLGSLNYFLGVFAQLSKSGLFLSQSKFAKEVLECAYMQYCNPCKTPVDTESKLGSDGDPICLYMHDPRDPYFISLKRILRYVSGTIDHGLQIHVSSTSQLTAYTDADWAGYPVTLPNERGTLSRSSAEAQYRAQRTKHIEIDIHFVREYVASGQVRVLHVPSKFQYADIFTKGLPTTLYLEFRSSLNVRRPPAQTAREY
ncbi:ribonuclease H-like domain-containing protein [Tanacetum coccineum]|uniref:Ribonuclease H-like domain-containing protein n=1 Tax=Tanacetum coccineum TaxID=301880 RepID=A0ABQ5FT25_9ASTR